MSDSTRASSASTGDLLRDFRGRGLMWPLLLTVLVHAALILATSVPYLRTALGGGKADLTEEQRLDAAVKQATASLQEIAKEHGDLKENSEYKMARQDHDTLAARRAEL